MPTTALIIAAVVVVAIVLVAARVYSSQRGRRLDAKEQRTQQLREQFGPEYDRTVAEKGDVRRGERELTARQKRVTGFKIKPLTADEGKGFNDEWQLMLATFVKDPSAAVHDADALIGRVMAARGYPESEFDQRFADVSVDHPAVLDHYRTAHDIALRDADGQADTEDLRQAVLSSSELFSEMVKEPPTVEPVPEAPVLEAPVPVGAK